MHNETQAAALDHAERVAAQIVAFHKHLTLRGIDSRSDLAERLTLQWADYLFRQEAPPKVAEGATVRLTPDEAMRFLRDREMILRANVAAEPPMDWSVVSAVVQQRPTSSQTGADPATQTTETHS